MLDTHTGISRVAEDRYTTVLDGGWSIGDSLNGGYTQLAVVRAVLAATRMIALAIDPKRRPTIIYESTVYPGVT